MAPLEGRQLQEVEGPLTPSHLSQAGSSPGSVIVRSRSTETRAMTNYSHSGGTQSDEAVLRNAHSVLNVIPNQALEPALADEEVQLSFGMIDDEVTRDLPANFNNFPIKLYDIVTPDDMSCCLSKYFAKTFTFYGIPPFFGIQVAYWDSQSNDYGLTDILHTPESWATLKRVVQEMQVRNLASVLSGFVEHSQVNVLHATLFFSHTKLCDNLRTLGHDFSRPLSYHDTADAGLLFKLFYEDYPAYTNYCQICNVPVLEPDTTD